MHKLILINKYHQPIVSLVICYNPQANESAQTHGELIYGVGRSFEASFRTEQIVLEYQQQNEVYYYYYYFIFVVFLLVVILFLQIKY